MQEKLRIAPISGWFPSGEGPLIVAGPCSAESERQVMETAYGLSKVPGVSVFRAGIWKPRTRPGSFEGVGSAGLQWLQRVRRETGLLTVVEVAKPQHVKEALDHGIDMLWIGARTVVNPFSVQEIGEAIAGHDIPVMIKNPLNPDLSTWLGAIERLNSFGLDKLVAVHRGFSFFNHSPYRNAPMWEIPIELMSLYPELPVLVDPSHICGNTPGLLPVIQKAFDLEMHGMMIEVHHQPGTALTDKHQQVTPAELKAILEKLVLRRKSETPEFSGQLENLRSEIDKLDEELIGILSRRMKVVEEIGKYKKANRITILQIRRWNHILHDRLEAGMKLGLSREFIMRLLQAVHEEGIQRQIDVMNRNGEEDPTSTSAP